MTRKITHLIKEHENISKPFVVEITRIPEDYQKIAVPILDTDEVLPLISRKESQQRKVTLPKEYHNQNGKRNTEMTLTGKKPRILIKNRSKIKKLQKVLEGTSQKENFQNWNFVGITEQCHRELHHDKAI